MKGNTFPSTIIEIESPHPRTTDKSISTSRVPSNIEELNGATVVTKCAGDRIDHSVKDIPSSLHFSPLVIATYISINHQEYQPPKQIWQKCLLAHANNLFTKPKANGWRGQRQRVSYCCCHFCVVMMTMMAILILS